ncbi:MAG: inositol monophosphatase family protein [Natronosporangium sp.]
MTNLDDLLRVALEATSLASEQISSRPAGHLTPKGDRDYASEVDYQVERGVRAFLAEATPTVGFLGEEEGASGDGSDMQWSLDPVDGIVNFTHALPLCGVSLALMAGNRAVLGVIVLPFLGTRYTAVHARGAYRDGEPIHVSKTTRLPDAVVSIGDYAVGSDSGRRNLPRLAVTARLASEALRVRMFGSVAVDLAWLAEGKTDASVTLSNRPWDTAAGAIIAREAGAVVVDSDGTEHTSESRATIAAPPTLVGDIVALVRAAEKTTDR